MLKPFDKEACYYDIFHQDKDYASEARKIRSNFPDAKTVLEIGCGTGSLTVELAKLGFEVEGIEPSAEMLRHGNKGGARFLIQTSIQDYPRYERFNQFDLILATYDALNYVPFTEIADVLLKIAYLSKEFYVEVWDCSSPVRPLTYKRANGCHRLRVGFSYNDQAYLWYIFWGKGLVISHHHLYLHKV